MSTLNNSAQNQLRQFIEQLERLEEEKKAIGDDIKEKFAEAKALGFDVKIMKQVLRLRRKSTADRQEEEAVLETYLHALGMKGTPLGDWAAWRDTGSSAAGADSEDAKPFRDDDGVWWKRDEHGALVEILQPQKEAAE